MTHKVGVDIISVTSSTADVTDDDVKVSRQRCDFQHIFPKANKGLMEQASYDDTELKEMTFSFRLFSSDVHFQDYKL